MERGFDAQSHTTVSSIEDVQIATGSTNHLTMLAIRRFQNPLPGSEEAKAIDRAREVQPRVLHLHTDLLERESYYLVKRIDKISKHVARVWSDRDGEPFIDCPCYRGKPPIDSRTKLPAFEPIPCTHAAAVLLFIAEKENQNVSTGS